MQFSHSALKKNRLSLSRLLSEIEKDSSAGREALNDLFAHTGRAHLIGVTGAPGTGKSSLVNHLALHYRKKSAEAKRVGIIAVDPSSPFSGGAVMGDRIRMSDLISDEGVFIRSMASRGSLGGLAAATAGMVQALDAADFDVIIIETVGAGQAEVEIAKLAHTTLVLEAPGLGDDVQAIKAGILEIADILVLNKADRPGVESAERALKGMLQLGHPIKRSFQHHGHLLEDSDTPEIEPTTDEWMTPLIRTVSTDGSGIEELINLIEEHKTYLHDSGEWEIRDRARLENELEGILLREMMATWKDEGNEEKLRKAVSAVQKRKISPRQAADQLLNGKEPK